MRTVRILNLSKNTILAGRAAVADRFFSRLRGLLSRDHLPPDSGLVIVPSNAVHGYFLRFSIDVVHLARDGQVIKTRDGLGPGGISAARGGYWVLELPTGTIERTRTEPGDHIRLEDVDDVEGWQTGQ